MTMPWFKTYPEARTDLKLRTLTRVQRSVWFDLLCYAAEQSNRGVIKFEDDHLLALEVADGDVDLLNGTIEKLQALRIVTVRPADETMKHVSSVSPVSSRFIVFLAFEKRQGGVSCNAKTSTDRVRKCRENKRLHRDETVKRDETPVKRDETTDRDREEEKKEYTTPQISERTHPVEAKSIPLKGESAPHQIKSQSSRSPEDLEQVRAAEKILAANLQTESLAWELGRNHNLSGMIDTPGWKWVRAAEKIVGPGFTKSQRETFNYFATIARNISDEDREKPKRFTSDESVPFKNSPPKNLFVGEKTRKRLGPEGLAKLGIAV